jgi:hypothetical protein
VTAHASTTGGAPGGNMGDDEPRTWLTYAETGRALGMQAGSAKRLSFRRHWPRRTGNDGLARVGVPAAELRRVISDDTGDAAGVAIGDNIKAVSGDSTGDVPSGNIGDSTKVGRDTAPAEILAVELAHVRVQLAAREGELAGLREALRVAEAGTREAVQRADRAEQTALDAWRTTVDLARLLAQAKAVRAPVQPSSPRRGWLGRWL